MMRRFVLAASAAFVALSALAPSAIAAEALYELTRVDPPPEWDKIELHAVNNAGDAAGRVYNRWPYRASPVIRRVDGRFEYLPRPPGCLKRGSYRVAAFNDRGQVLMGNCDGRHPAWRWTPGTGWEAVDGWVGGNVALGMNNQGKVVGSYGDGQGAEAFLWRGPGDYDRYTRDGGLEFNAINDRGDIAATIYHLADPDIPYDREGQTAALIPVGGDPIPTGDGNIHTLRDYQNLKHAWYHLNSRAGGINANGEIALGSPATFHRHRPNYRRTSCGWYGAEQMACADHSAPRDNPLPVGVDGVGNVVMRGDAKYPDSYVMTRDGVVHTLGLASEPPTSEDLVAYGVSESGFIVGRYGRGIGRRTDAFILKPKH